MEKLTAIVIGATGLVCRQLINQLLEDENYEKIKILHRRSISKDHPKIEEHIINFEEPDSYKTMVSGDVLFSGLGTTVKTAGGQEAQYKVDYTYNFEAAKLAADNGVKHYILISSAGADAKSSVFYSRMKGELDEAVKALSFEHITILRPSVLDGDRQESRPGEKLGIFLGNAIIKHIPGLKKWRPIKTTIVAEAMRKAILHNKDKYRIYDLEEVFELASS